MFDDLTMGAETEVTPTSESTEQVIETTEQTVDENVVDTQSTEDQGNIQDAISNEEKTVPVDVVEAIKQELKDAKDREHKLLNLVLQGQLNNQQQEKEPEPEVDIFNGIEDDTVLFGADVKRILNQFKESINADRAKETQSVREQQILQHEQSFREINVDYDDVIKVLPKNIVQSLYSTYNDPAEFINIAYKVGKALTGRSPPNNSNQSTLKQKVDVENKINQNIQKPKSISQAKGKSNVEKTMSANDIYNEIFGR